jgi:hypothetical protein
MNNTETLFLIVPSVYSSVYFVLCLVYPMLSVSLFCLFLIVPSVYSSVYFVRQPRMNNPETLTTLDTQDTGFSVSLCCLFLIVPSVYSCVYFVLCLVYPMLSVSVCYSFLIVPRMNNTETLTTSDTQDTGQNKH